MTEESSDVRSRCALLRRVSLVIWLALAASAAVFITFFDGLTATAGGIVDGVHFIGGHGEYREVSQQQFAIMLVVEKLVFALFAAGFLSMLVHNLTPGCRDAIKGRLWPW